MNMDAIQTSRYNIIDVYLLLKVELRGVSQVQAEVQSTSGLPSTPDLDHPRLLVEAQPLPLLVHVDVDGV